MRTRLLLVRMDARNRIERLQRAIAWRLPKWLLRWALVRCFAAATTGAYGTTHPDEIGYSEVYRRNGF